MLLLRHLHFKMYTLNKDGELIMVKKIAVALLCATLGTSLQAREDISTSKLFIGVEIDSTKVDGTRELIVTDNYFNEVDSLYKASATGSSVIEYGIHVGAEKEDWRTTLLYTYSSEENDGIDETMHKGAILLDYFIWNSGSTEYNVKPYLGAHVGYMNYEASVYDVQYGVDQIIMDDSGIYYGAQAGIAMTISEVVQLDLSYRYSFTSIEDTDTLDYLGNGYWLDSVYSLDNMGTISFSLNYFY